MTTLSSSGCAGTVTDRLRGLAALRGTERAVTALGRSPATATLTWAQFDAAADSVAAWVGPRCAPGDRVAVVAGRSPVRVAAFLGVLRAGCTAVPLDLPADEAAARRLVASVADSDPAMVLTTWTWTARLRSLLGGVRVLPADALPCAEEPRDPQPRATDPACLALVRAPGSRPTGVELTHADLWAGAVSAADAVVAGTAAGVVVSGLSLATPLGLAVGIGVPLVTGLRSVLLEPADVARDPLRWVTALADNPGCATAAPGVTFDLAAKRAHRSRARLDGVVALLDLGGAAQHSGVDRFLEEFAEHGLSPSVKRTAYAPWDLPPVVASGAGAVRAVGFGSHDLGRGDAVPAGFSRPVSVLSGSGRPAPGDVRVVDPATGTPLADGRVGELRVRAPGGLCRDGVRTGDLGVLRRGELYVLGQAAEVLAVGGLLLPPHDIERVAEVAHPAVRAGGVAAFTVPTAEGDRVVVVVERSRTGRAGAATGAEVANAVRAAVRATFDLTPHDVVLVEAGDIHRCDHGGVLRLATRDHHLTGVRTASGG